MWSRGEYFEQKNRRIVQQFEDEGSFKSSIFQGVIVYIDGFTRVPYQELRQLICNHGGSFEPALYNVKITHFVAENVSRAKLLDLKSKRDLYVVKPDWITDSVKEGKRLNETAYSLIRNTVGIEHQLSSTEKREQSVDPSSYTPEKVFQKSRFHVMGEIKTALQNRVIEVYNEANQPLPMDPGEDCIYAHIDMDCYFVQIALQNSPQYKDSPVAVSSSDSTHSEISSCNYKARTMGVTKGMWMKRAKEFCPTLVVLPYDFERIEQTSRTIVEIVLRYTTVVQIGSCDELFCDVSVYKDNNQFLDVLQTIKREIAQTTGCSCSIGISHNLLMARIATKKAKPDGLVYIPFQEIQTYLDPSPVSVLPGVGQALQNQLDKIGVQVCKDLQRVDRAVLFATVGEKTGMNLLHFSQGQDSRILTVIPNAQSIGVQVSYGVRCSDRGDVVNYICSLCNMLVKKLQEKSVSGYKLTAKFYKRIPEEVTAKFMGHGPVTIVNMTHTHNSPIAQYETLLRLAVMLYDNSRILPEDVRGIGLSVKNLITQKEYSSIHHFFSSSTPSPSKQTKRSPVTSRKESAGKRQNTIQALIEKNGLMRAGKLPSPTKPMVVLPSLQDLDRDVFVTLPEELQKEMAEYYLQSEETISNETLLLFNKVLNNKERVTADERELVDFLQCVSASSYSIEDTKMILKYMKEYSVTVELETVLEEIIRNKLKNDFCGTHEIICILKKGLASADNSWKNIVIHLECIYEENLNSL